MLKTFTLWIDADACPKTVREVVYRAAHRLNFKVVVVSNSYLTIPQSPLIRAIQVDQGSDVADDYVVENSTAGDIVITSDIPLAARVVEKGSIAIDHRGEEYTEENVRERLSVRDFMKDIRDSGVITGGPAPYGPKDLEHFTNALNRLLTKLTK